MTGTWSEFRNLTLADEAVFKASLYNLHSVTYTATEVSTQLVSGMNFRFKADATVKDSEETWKVTVEVYQPRDKSPRLEQIIRL